MTGFLAALAIVGTIGSIQVKEAPLQDPFPEPERQYYTATFETKDNARCKTKDSAAINAYIGENKFTLGSRGRRWNRK